MANDALRSAVYSLLTVIAVSAAAARICNVELLYEPSMYRAEGDADPDAPPRDWPKVRPTPMPTLSSNDRSRWCTVRALVDEGTWVIGHRYVNADGSYRDAGIVFEDGWQTVDKVLDPRPQGEGIPLVRNYYSSKPPLLTFVTAGAYWLLKHTLGWSITRDTNLVVKTILLAFNAVPFALFLVMMRRLIERARHDGLGPTVYFRRGLLRHADRAIFDHAQ